MNPLFEGEGGGGEGGGEESKEESVSVCVASTCAKYAETTEYFVRVHFALVRRPRITPVHWVDYW